MNSFSGGALPIGRIVATVGATLMALVMAGTSVVAVVWAVVRLIGLPDFFLWGLMALGAVPVIWATVWTAGRAWHVEQLLETGGDIDQPEFKLGAYLRKK